MLLSDPRETVETFAEPGEGKRFSMSLADAAGIASRAPGIGGAAAGLAMLELDAARHVLANPELYRDVVVNAERSTRLAGTLVSENAALEEAYDQRIAALRNATGVELENPMRNGYARDARRRIRDEMRADPTAPLAETGGVPAFQRRIFDERFEAAINAAGPDKLPEFGDLGTRARAIAKAAAETPAPAGVNPIAGFAASFVGSLWGQRRDPLFVGSLFAGPTSAVGKQAITRVATSGLFQGLYNMGITLFEQPVVQKWRAEIGTRSGIVPALEETALAFVFGLIPGAAIRGLQEMRVSVREALERVLAGKPQAGDAEIVTKAFGGKLTPEDAAAVRAGEASEANARAAIGDPPRGVDGAEHVDIANQALRHGEDPANNPPPEIAVGAPARPRDQVKVIDEALPAKIGERELVDGKSVTFAQLDPRAVGADAAAFQFKGGGDATGVTDRLRNVTAWDPLAAGKFFFFEFADGRTVVADGHQRLGLAKRLVNENGARINLDGYVFREVDGWTPADVRALAAKKNMQEGSGDALDVARMLRLRPDLVDGALPVTGPMMKNAIALARLSDEAFGMASNGVVPPNYAAAVGAMVPDQLQHAAVMADLVRFAPETEREARILIGEIMAAGFRSEQQINLFGAALSTRSLMGERVKVIDTALQQLVKDKKLFGTLAEQADTIEDVGNVLARQTNEQRATDAATLADLITRLAQRTGPVSDAVNRAAAAIADGTLRRAEAADRFLDDVRGLLDRDGLVGLLATPELRPRTVVEPGTPEALAAAELGAAERTRPVSPNEGAATQVAGGVEITSQRPSQGADQAAVPSFREFISGQAGVPIEELHARAGTLQADLGAAGEEVATAVGAKLANPGVKSLATAQEKLGRKGYEDAGQVTDLARIGFIVHTAEQADGVVEGLATRFEILDEGWKVGPAGYIDRKILIRAEDGTIGEVQIIPEPMYAAKRGGGQTLYTRERGMADGPEREAVRAEARAFYSAAAGKLGDDWAGILPTSSAPKSASNVARQSASDMTADVLNTSELSTLDQPAPDLSTAKASPEAVSTAGRQSQLTNVGDAAINANISSAAAADKAEPSLFDAIAVSSRADGRDTRLITREQALAEADRPALHADLVASCKD